MLDDGIVDETDYMRSLDFAKKGQKRIEEALLELGVLDEATLLKFVATMHRTQFVSTEKLSKARIDDEALKVVNKQTARRLNIYPLMLDRINEKLIVATADPD